MTLCFLLEPDRVRLVGGTSCCEGILELKHLRDWRPVFINHWNLKAAAVVCEHLDCGSAVSAQSEDSTQKSVWLIRPDCIKPGSALWECAKSGYSSNVLKVTCSAVFCCTDHSLKSFLVLNTAVSSAQQQGFQVSRGSSFTISCSIRPQYPGGSFQLTFTSSNAAYSYTQPAVNHSAHFLFPAAEPAHQGNYSCVYHVYVFSHNFSSESRQLSVTVSDPTDPAAHNITGVVLLVIVLFMIAALYFYCKASRGQKSSTPDSTELVYYNFSVCSAEGGPTKEEGAQAAEEDLHGDHLTSR
ncbi:hypothetical protein ACER0C_004912 [Sarotherodon galilaeus]